MRTFLLLLGLLCYITSSAQPINDLCANAISLSVDATCTTNTYTNMGATDSGELPSPNCGLYQGSDIWFTFEVPASGNMVIDATGTATYPIASIYTGSCGTLSLYDCQGNGPGPVDSRILISDISLAGQIIYLRIHSYNSNNGNNFDLCLYEVDIPTNDDCTNAIDMGLVSGTTCNYTTYNNSYATTETGLGDDPGCSLYQGGDVWFTFEVSASGNMVIDATGTATYPIASIYTGSCGTLSLYDCQGNGPGPVDSRILISDISLAGQIIYLRIHSYNSSNGNNFDLCLYEVDIPTNDDCTNAIDMGLVSGTTCNYTTYNNSYATTETGLGDDPGCSLYQGADVWFTFEVPASGNMVIDATGTATYPIASIYTGSCGTLSLYDCQGNGPGAVDSRILISDISLAGQTMYLRVHSYNTIYGNDFDLCLYEVDVPTNDDCANAIDMGLVSGTTCNYSTYSNSNATTETGLGDDPGCSLYQGADVWFTFEVPASGNMVIDATGTATYPIASIYTGSCGTLSLYDCQGNGPGAVDSRILISDISLAGQTMYLRIHSYNTIYGNDFDICLYEVDIPTNDDCANAIDFGLISGTTCNYNTYTNLHSTTEAVLGETPNCGLYKGSDVWFTLEMPTSGHLSIDAEGTSTYPIISVFTGTCGSLVLLDCYGSGPSSIDSRIIIHDESLAGEILYVCMHSYNSKYGNEFDICIYEPDTPDADFCGDAKDLGTPNGNINAFVNYDATHTTGNDIYGSSGCGLADDVDNDFWFKFTVPPSGTVTVETSNMNSPVVALYEGVDCSSLNLYSCDNDGSGLMINYDEITKVGQTVYIRVSSYNSFFNLPFELRIYETTPLPVELTSFSVEQVEKDVRLKWATSSEINNRHFEVEHSTNGENFDIIGTVEGNGNSAVNNYYSFMHHTPSLGINYYRLKQIDFDGQFEFSSIESINYKGSSTVLVYPTPSNGKFRLELTDQILSDGPILLKVHNSVGKFIMEKEVNNSVIEWELPDSYPSGIYWISAANRLELFGTMLLIQRE